MKIPVAIVDDGNADRYVARRRLAKSGYFGEILESAAGDAFVDGCFSNGPTHCAGSPVPLILMDVNMPRMNGFETVEEIQRRMAQGHGPADVVIVMFTSSNNRRDRDRANRIALIRGYVLKPLDSEKVEQIRDIYLSAVG